MIDAKNIKTLLKIEKDSKFDQRPMTTITFLDSTGDVKTHLEKKFTIFFFVRQFFFSVLSNGRLRSVACQRRRFKCLVHFMQMDGNCQKCQDIRNRDLKNEKEEEEKELKKEKRSGSSRTLI